MLADGYHEIPPGKIATIVTSLEMRERPAPRHDPDGPWTLRLHDNVDLETYRALYRQIGAEWFWFSRAFMDDAELAPQEHVPGVEVYFIEKDGVAEGLLELDFRKDDECELVFFGVCAGLVGTGAGRWLMNRAIERAWSQPIRKFWLHTCTLDSPQALPFYMRSGFVPFKRSVEIADDPRLTGYTPRDAAPHLPVIG